MKTTRIAALAAAMAGAATALAGTASADPATGNYTGTMIDGGGKYQQGDKVQFTLKSCGSDCINLAPEGNPGWELHRQGNNWIGPDPNGTATLDGSTLILTLDQGPGNHYIVGFTKNV